LLPDAGCDEVSCVLNHYEGACCAKFRKPAPVAPDAPARPAVTQSLPDDLDRAMISDAVAKVKAPIRACGDQFPAKGQVKVSVKVRPDGFVAAVTVKNTPSPELGACVAARMETALFARTLNGGSFSYPYTF
jgi:hypothetical protein